VYAIWQTRAAIETLIISLVRNIKPTQVEAYKLALGKMGA